MSEEKTSLCNVYKDNTSRIINKLEMQIPSHFQIYSDMYKEYLHVMDDVFGACLLAEKEFEDKINVNDDFMKNLQSYADHMTQVWINQIESYGLYLKWHSQVRISGMKSFDDVVHSMMGYYSKLLSNFSEKFEK